MSKVETKDAEIFWPDALIICLGFSIFFPFNLLIIPPAVLVGALVSTALGIQDGTDEQFLMFFFLGVIVIYSFAGIIDLGRWLIWRVKRKQKNI